MKVRHLALLLLAALVLRAQEPTPRTEPPAKPLAAGASLAELIQFGGKFTNAVTLKPGPEDGNIAQTYATLLRNAHYTRQAFNDEVSQRFFDRYLESWDPQHLFLLQGDHDEFKPLRNQLDELTLRYGDTGPAYDIFNRFLQRYDQCYGLVTDLLQNERFTFESDEEFTVDRKDEPPPRDLAAARQLWRDRLRYEYLAEKLSAFDPAEIMPVIREKLSAGQAGELATVLTNKLSATKAEALAKLARERLEQDRQTPEQAAAALLERLEQDRHQDIVQQLARRYNRMLRNLKQFESDEVLQVWLDALGHAYDPHTDYLGRRELEQFSIQMNLSLFGIGATLQDDDGYTVIRSIVAGSPAEKSKQIKVGDKIVGVAQGEGEFEDVIGDKLSDVVDRIRGPKGTEVRLQVMPEGADSSVRKVVAIIRDEIKLEDGEATSKLIELPRDEGQFTRLGVIDLPSFYANFQVGGRRGSGKTTTGDVAQLIKKLTAEGAEGIVLDLRRNGGGSLEEAINLTGLFIKSGPVVQVRNYDGSVLVEEDEDPAVTYDGPLLVLTSRFSASASEILAGALQDYGRAVVVGDSSTHGKGTVQTVQELRNFVGFRRFQQNPGAAKVTIRKFYRANGESTQLKGVTPDIVLPGVNNHLEVGEAALENALPWDTIPSADFEKVNRIRPVLAELRRNSETRLGQNPDFAFVREDVERFNRRKEQKQVSLNEARRRAEKGEDKTRAESRQGDVMARHQKQPVTYEISLKRSLEEGLPAPVTNKVVVAVSRADLGALLAQAEEDGLAGVELPPEAGVAAPVKADEPRKPEKIAADLHLEEAQRILLDLIQISARRPATAKVP